MAHRHYRCAVCGFESSEHTTCPKCMASTLDNLPVGGMHTPHRPKQARSAALDELAAALNPPEPPPPAP